METKTMTVNVGKKTMDEFRKMAESVYGKRKGSLGKAATEAFEQWVDEKKSQDAAVRALELLNKKRRFRIGTLNREELHVR